MNPRVAFVGTLLLVFQVAALRIAWDRFRNLLGLTFVFIALTILKSNYRHKWWLVGVFAMLTVLSRDYIALVLFVAVLGFAILKKNNRVVSIVALAPASTVFFITFFSRRLWWQAILEGRYVLNNYLVVMQDVFSIFLICYLSFLPFIMKGFERNELLDPLLGWLFLGSFSVVISPWFVIPGYQRWLMLLVFPFSVYAARGFERFRLFDKGNLRKLVAIILVFMVIGVGYSSGVFSYVWVVSNSWVPINLVQSSIAWEHVDDAKGVLEWLNENAMFNSSLLAEERFYGWALIYLERANVDVKVIVYAANSLPKPALEKALEDGFRWIYLICILTQAQRIFK